MKESIYNFGKKREISGKHNENTRIWQIDLSEMVLKQPQTNNVTLTQLSRVVLWAKNATCNVRN